MHLAVGSHGTCSAGLILAVAALQQSVPRPSKDGRGGWGGERGSSPAPLSIGLIKSQAARCSRKRRRRDKSTDSRTTARQAQLWQLKEMEVFKRRFVSGLVVGVLALLVAGTVVTPVSAAPNGRMVHIVRRGETLCSIPCRYGLDVWTVARAKGIAHPSRIYVGQRLAI